MLEASNDVPLDPKIGAVFHTLADAMGGDEAHRDALTAAYRIGWLAGHDAAKLQAAAALNKAIGKPRLRIPAPLSRQAGYVRLDYDAERSRRFFRTAREAFGHSLDFRAPRDPDWIVGVVCTVGAIALGLMMFAGLV
ncbi:MAG: hypothetical protein ING91_19345 [Rhodocyclaceae bacterium]|nr:hypothetical protein [Rhodocyclaceae bacterium]MCA3116390.1 hypothetical protein [Rhodocyclaceae bacterium]MCA3127065.1 hypothetical protein [Rhodocyclaceae bacterium]